MSAAAIEYRTRAETRRATFAALSRQELRLSQLRLVVFGTSAVIAVLAWRGTVSGWWLLAPLALFTALAWRHDRTLRARDAAAGAVAFYERGLARIEDRWAGTGEPGDRFRDEHHLYATDLDLFGPGSLFELLSLARTRAGEETLAGWLKAPATRDTISARHDAVRELATALDLREALSLAGADVRAAVHTVELIAWADGPRLLSSRWLRLLSIISTCLTVIALAWLAWSDQYIPLLLAIAVQGLIQAAHRPRVQTVLHRAEAPARELMILLHLLQGLEREHFRAARLVDLSSSLNAARASAIIRRLQWLVEAHDWEHNMVFAPIGALLNWSAHLALSVERWRGLHGRMIEGWLLAVGEIEALSSLSAYHYEHPDDPFPEIVPPQEPSTAAISRDEGSPPRSEALFDGTSLGHPLLASSLMVRNDVRLGGDVRLLVVSGSNMSGKSTLLRTVGVNSVLALAGAPVRAGSLRLSPLAIGATLRIQDSLQEGRSRFFAEITRIRDIVNAARGPLPVLFLLDELFHGTNSHDRLVGASGVLASLMDLGAIGLITTHDLALTAVAGELAPRAANVHFEDVFDGGEIRFDYRMKPGPVRRSNALALMRAVGLDVKETTP